MVRPSVRGREIRGCGPGGDLLFRRLSGSTIGAEGFHGRVRDGIGCFAPRYGHQAMQALPRSDPGLGATGVAPEEASCECLRRGFVALLAILAAGCGAQANRAISTGQLRGLLRFHLRPIDVVVYHGSQRDLVLKGVSRLDAFSGYPVRT